MTYLEITTKNGLGRRTVELREKPLRVGRAGNNDIVLRDTRVSRHHCVIETVAGKPIIRDLGSVRGIKVNNRKREESDLRPGDRVRIGPFTIALREETSSRRNERPLSTPAPGATGNLLDSWDDSSHGGAGDNDATANPDALNLALADDGRDDSRGDSDSTSSGEGSSTGGADPNADRRIDELTEQLANLERFVRQREESFGALHGEMAELHDDRAAETLRRELEEQRAEVRSTIGSQRLELANLIEHRGRQIEKLHERLERLDRVVGRMEQIEAAVVAVPALASRVESADAHVLESAERLDKLATAQEQMAFEHSQVAAAVHELAARLASIDESLHALPALTDRINSLEESSQQNAINARVALEEATQMLARVEHMHDLTLAAEERVTDLAMRQADSAAKVTAHEETLHHGSQQLVRLSKLIEDMSRQQHALGDERGQLASSVGSLHEQIGQVREWFDELEQRIAGLPKAAGESSESASAAAHVEAWRRENLQETAALRRSLDAIGARLNARIERLEGASADAVPELSALKEQVRRLSDARPREAAPAPRPPALVVTRTASAPASTAVLERPNLARHPSTGPSGVPSSIDAEQQRQVMSRIFQGKEEQDERYRPARDRSTIALFVFVLVVALGVAVAWLGPMLLGSGG